MAEMDVSRREVDRGPVWGRPLRKEEAQLIRALVLLERARWDLERAHIDLGLVRDIDELFEDLQHGT